MLIAHAPDGTAGYPTVVIFTLQCDDNLVTVIKDDGDGYANPNCGARSQPIRLDPSRIKNPCTTPGVAAALPPQIPTV